MTQKDQDRLGKTLWAIADNLRGAMNADSFRDYMLHFCFCATYQATTKNRLEKNWVRIILSWQKMMGELP